MFSVDTDALRDFAGFLGGYADDAELVREFIDDDVEMTVHGEGVLNKLAGFHYDTTSAMRSRVGVMRQLGAHASSEIDEAATYVYDELETEEAAGYDKLYDGASDPGALPSSGDASTASFDYHSVEAKLKVDRDPDELEPKAGDVEKYTRDGLDLLSFADEARKLITWVSTTFGIYEGDPVEWVFTWLTGNWEAWAKCALVWQACGKAVDDMAANFEPTFIKLMEVWQGNAAEAALEYFAELRRSTAVEADAFGVIYQQYKLITELIHEMKQYINDFVNALISAAIDAVLMVATGGVPGLIKAIIDAIATLITVLISQVKVAETVIEMIKLEPVPDSTLPDLPGQGKPPTYDHPSSV